MLKVPNVDNKVSCDGIRDRSDGNIVVNAVLVHTPDEAYLVRNTVDFFTSYTTRAEDRCR